MKKHVVRCLVYGSMLAATVATAFAPRHWVCQHGLDFWNVPALEAEVAEHEAAIREFDSETLIVLKRIAEKDAVVLELVYGHISLVEAARCFHSLNAGNWSHQAALEERYPGMNADECVYLNVIEYAERMAAERPETAREIVQLKRQFESLRHRGGLELGV